jgi:hypothetical protein
VGRYVSWVVCLAACVYDPEAPCGESHQLDAKGQHCICAEGMGNDGGGGCRPCTSDEVWTAGVCIVATDAGRDCDPANPDCPSPLTCHEPVGYCTMTDCGECPAGFYCDTSTTPSYCQRPPTGQAAPCSSAADCAGFEATYCEMIQGHVCLVQGCTLSPNDCFYGWSCCDLTLLIGVTLCVPDGECPTG